MLSIFKCRLLCSLASRPQPRTQYQSIQGLTLIELLVVIVMLGILVTISGSTFLNAATRAKQSEAKVNVGSMLKAQQAHYVEQGAFALDLSNLGLGITPQTRHYDYQTHQGGGRHFDRDGNQVQTLAIAIAIPRIDVRGYMGKAWLDVSSGAATVNSVVCEGDIRATYFMNGKTYCD